MIAPPVRYGIIGHGWRAGFYFRLARQAPGRFQCVGAVTRTAAAGAPLEQAWGIRTYRHPEHLAAAEAPEVIVTSIPRAANPEVVESLVKLGIPVLSETPPAPDLPALRQLWTSAGPAGLVHVAEQHPRLPIFSALRSLVQHGILGQVTSAHISWTHDYHAMALLRDLLGLGYEPARVTALQAAGPLIEGPGRQGWPAAPQVRDTAHTLAMIEAAGRTGVYDFTDGQWFNPLRRRHVILRGSHGEVIGTSVTWSSGDGTPLSAPITRHQTGTDGNLEGAGLTALTWAGEVLYRNPYPGTRMSDEEIAIATCLEQTALWHRDGTGRPYSLAEACQDQILALAIHAAARNGAPVTTDVEPWATVTSAQNYSK
jgi:predicted dehydrogenase